jgi:hypothetical protein
MILKIFGGLSLIVGLFLLIGGPGDRGQIAAYGNTARLLGAIFIAIGIILLKW